MSECTCEYSLFKLLVSLFFPVPCVPADVEVKVNCSTSQAVVSWSASTGALSYKVVAENTQNDRTFCETAELTCTLTNLTCGYLYSVQVVAEGETCSSLPSQDVEFSPGRTKGYTSVLK